MKNVPETQRIVYLQRASTPVERMGERLAGAAFDVLSAEPPRATP